LACLFSGGCPVRHVYSCDDKFKIAKAAHLGIFKAIALSGVRERITACYGFIPGDTNNAKVHGLGLFLSESVLDFAPLSGDRCSEDKVTQKAD
jgi:hypothetical protein